MQHTHRNRRSTRLQDYDYTTPGAYFVTICTHDHECLFGEIVESEIILNDAGRVVEKSWKWLAIQYPYVELDSFIIMPNHLHGIVSLLDPSRGGSRTAPTAKRKPLDRLIGVFKTVSSKQINKLRDCPGARVWQRSFYEHVVRRTDKINRIRKYIINNPARWAFDIENPGRDKM